jgi:hypothetical protein
MKNNEKKTILKNKIVEVYGIKYIVSTTEQISVNDLITNGYEVRIYDDSYSLMGWNKIIATEDDLGFVKVEGNNRLFDCETEIQVDYVPINNNWINAILERGGFCNIEDIKEEKLVLNF